MKQLPCPVCFFLFLTTLNTKANSLNVTADLCLFPL
uniref:Uncharacterized protein n=1 Tax=Anguilla anguilla TaxID=7936 RepID=A0A0E9W4T6_ANGAN